jgi:hypothetical protein
VGLRVRLRRKETSLRRVDLRSTGDRLEDWIIVVLIVSPETLIVLLETTCNVSPNFNVETT